MSNSSNEFGVSYFYIKWMETALSCHANVLTFSRSRDILFNVRRKNGPDIKLVCLDEYTCGLEMVFRVQSSFSEVNFIYVGGVWNGYTLQAKEYCIESGIGLFNTSELTGALFKNDFWQYHKRDDNGNPEYAIR